MITETPERVRRLVLLDPAIGLDADAAAHGAATALAQLSSRIQPRPGRIAACRAASVEVADVDSDHQLLLERLADTGGLVRKFLA